MDDNKFSAARETLDDAAQRETWNRRARWLIPLITLLVWAAWMPATVRVTYGRPSDALNYAEAAERAADGDGVLYRGHYGIGLPIWRPMHNWPPGWSLIVAPLCALGVPALPAAVFMNLVFAAIGVVMLGATCARLLPPGVALAVALATVSMPVMLKNSTYGAADLQFVVVAMGSLIFLDRAAQQNDWRSAVFAGFLAGLAFTLRYVGLTLFISSAALLLLNFVMQRDGAKFLRQTFAWGCGVAVLVVPLAVYNFMGKGKVLPFDWAKNQDPLITVCRDTLAGLIQQLTTSWEIGYDLADKRLVAVAAVLGLGLGVWVWFKFGARKILALLERHQLLASFALFSCLYMAALLSARLKYHLTDGAHGVWDRYLIPFLWFFWLLLAASAEGILEWAKVPVRVRRGALIVLFGGVALLQTNAFVSELRQSSPAPRSLAEYVGEDTAVYLQQAVGEDQIVLSDEARELRLFGDINARFFSPQQFAKTILRGPTREEMIAAAEKGLLWGIVISDVELVLSGHYGEMIHDLVRYPERFPELERVDLGEETLVYRYVVKQRREES